MCIVPISAVETKIEPAHQSAIPIAVPARHPMCPFEPARDPRLDALRPDPHEGPRDVLPRLVEGDPLDLLQCCARHLADEALLLDLERLHARSLALVARRSVEASEDNVDEWLAGRVSDAATQLIDEERYEDRLGFPPPREADPRSELLVAVLGIEPALSRGVSVTFHRMSRQARRTFWRAVVSGEPIAGIAEDRDSTRESVLEGLRHVIRSLSLSGVEENAQSKPEPGDPGQEKS